MGGYDGASQSSDQLIPKSQINNVLRNLNVSVSLGLICNFSWEKVFSQKKISSSWNTGTRLATLTKKKAGFLVGLEKEIFSL